MKIKWLIQETGIIMQSPEANFNAVEALGLPYAKFGLIAATKTISNLETILTDPKEKFIIRGGTRLLSWLDNIKTLKEVNGFLSSEQLKHNKRYIERLKDGIFYDDKTFDQAYYGQLDLPLLNSDAHYLPIKDILTINFNIDMFIKPSKDQKSFNAGILKAGNFVEQFLNNQNYVKNDNDEMAVIAPCKAMIAEYRFFVVDKEVITGCRYHFAGKMNLHASIPQDILEVAKEYAKLYQPHDIFTMDLAETENGVKIVEYNCWNASSLYKTDVKKIFDAVHQYKSQNKINHIKTLKLS